MKILNIFFIFKKIFKNKNKNKNEYIEKIKNIEKANLQIKKEFMFFQENLIYKKLISKFSNNFLICPQVPFGAFISNITYDKTRSKTYNDYINKKIFSSYGCLVADFLICKRDNREPICIIEFNGSGHYGNDQVIKNDNLKKLITKKINLKLYIINGNDIYFNDNKNKIDFNKLDQEILKIEKYINN